MSRVVFLTGRIQPAKQTLKTPAMTYEQIQDVDLANLTLPQQEQMIRDITTSFKTHPDPRFLWAVQKLACDEIDKFRCVFEFCRCYLNKYDTLMPNV